MVQDICPVFPRIPGDFVWGVNLDGHDLAHFAALDDNDGRPDASASAAALLAAADVLADEWIIVSHIRPWYDVCRLDRESDGEP